MKNNKSKTGKRSGFEDLFHGAFPHFEYESQYFEYSVSEVRKYKPDFIDRADGTWYETKGRFTAADRKKMMMIKKHYPFQRIVMVFQNPNQKLTKAKNSKSYASWCESKGFEWTTLKDLKEEYYKV